MKVINNRIFNVFLMLLLASSMAEARDHSRAHHADVISEDTSVIAGNTFDLSAGQLTDFLIAAAGTPNVKLNAVHYSPLSMIAPGWHIRILNFTAIENGQEIKYTCDFYIRENRTGRKPAEMYVDGCWAPYANASPIKYSGELAKYATLTSGKVQEAHGEPEVQVAQ